LAFSLSIDHHLINWGGRPPGFMQRAPENRDGDRVSNPAMGDEYTARVVPLIASSKEENLMV